MKSAPSFPPHRPDRLDVRRLAQEQARIEGEIPWSRLPRLAADAHASNADKLEPLPIHWEATGQLRRLHAGASQTRMHLRVAMTFPMQCQNCLESVMEPVNVDREFIFVADEDTACAMDDEAEEDVLVASKSFNLLELIEDELIMALPLVPRHKVCPSPLSAPPEDVQVPQPTDRVTGAFDALQALKRR